MNSVDNVLYHECCFVTSRNAVSPDGTQWTVLWQRGNAIETLFAG